MSVRLFGLKCFHCFRFILLRQYVLFIHNTLIRLRFVFKTHLSTKLFDNSHTDTVSVGAAQFSHRVVDFILDTGLHLYKCCSYFCHFSGEKKCKKYFANTFW